MTAAAAEDEITPIKPESASLLATFKKLKTVEFYEYQCATNNHTTYYFTGRDNDYGHHGDFRMSPSEQKPQEWMGDQFGLDVIGNAALGKIQFVMKVEKSRRVVNVLVPRRDEPLTWVCKAIPISRRTGF